MPTPALTKWRTDVGTGWVELEGPALVWSHPSFVAVHNQLLDKIEESAKWMEFMGATALKTMEILHKDNQTRQAELCWMEGITYNYAAAHLREALKS